METIGHRRVSAQHQLPKRKFQQPHLQLLHERQWEAGVRKERFLSGLSLRTMHSFCPLMARLDSRIAWDPYIVP